MSPQYKIALAKLERPFLPLASLLQLLFLTGPFSKVEEILSELNEPIETRCRYNDPQAAAAPYLDIIRYFKYLKSADPLNFIVINEQGEQLDRMEAVALWVGQNILTRELAEINSLLCGSQSCDLCCTGPTGEDKQEFFEIPLQKNEINQFNILKIDSADSRNHTPNDEQALVLDDKPFYQKKAPTIYHWHKGWSLILPRQTSCPHLDTKGRCLTYAERPAVCRRPQIFPYLLEPSTTAETGATMPVYIVRRKLLAIWDCPYVKQFQNQIAAYAEICDLDPVFKENKQ